MTFMIKVQILEFINHLVLKLIRMGWAQIVHHKESNQLILEMEMMPMVPRTIAMLQAWYLFAEKSFKKFWIWKATLKVKEKNFRTDKISA